MGFDHPKIWRIARTTPSRIAFAPGRVSLVFDGNSLRYTVRDGRARNHVGEWHRGKKILYVDNMLNGLDRRAIIIHEAIEKYVAQRYRVDIDSTAHRLAQAIERKWLTRHHRSWRSHQMVVYWIWRNRGRK